MKRMEERGEEEVLREISLSMPNNKADMGLPGAGKLVQAEGSELGFGNEANLPCCTWQGACKPAPP